MKFVDSHAHINSEDFRHDRDQVIARSFQEDILAILCPADLTEPESLQVAIELNGNFPDIFVIAGIHPHNTQRFSPDAAKILSQLSADNTICAVGEIGLDFHYNYSSPEEQRNAFRSQLNFAEELDLPVVIHSRNAADEIATAIEEENFTKGGVLHCFTENWDFAERMLDHNFLISFSGILTYPNAQSIQDVAKRLPLQKILIETDSPYLVPVPYRGRVKRNEPVYVKEVAKALADLRKTDLGEIARATTRNFASLFPFEL
jgi:TatD DNase family protein